MARKNMKSRAPIGKAKKATRRKAAKQSRREAERVLKTGPIRKRTAREQPLPGMEDARIRPLDDVCANIADTRAQINELKAEEAGFEQTALNLMRQHRRTTSAHAGVTLVRVPGEEKVQVKTTRTRTTTAENQQVEDQGDEQPDDVLAMDGEDAGDEAGDELLH